MRKSLILTGLLFIVSSLSAQVIFDNGSFNQVLEKAKKENKKVFVDCYTSWCGPCKMLVNDIFPNKEVGEYMNEKFINFKVDMEKGEGLILKKKYNITVFPTLLLLNSDGSEYSRSVGAESDVNGFIANLEKMLNNDMVKSREKFKTSLDGANSFIQMLNDNYMIAERDKALVSVYNRRNAAENYNAENFKLYSALISNIYHPVALSILNDSNNAIHYLGKKRYAEFVKEKVDFTLTEMAMKYSITADKINEIAMMSKKYKEMKTPLLNYFIKLAQDIDGKNVEPIIAYSSKIFKNLDRRERGDVARFVHRTAVTNKQTEKLIPFYELCIAHSNTPEEAKIYQASLDLVKKLLTK